MNEGHTLTRKKEGLHSYSKENKVQKCTSEGLASREHPRALISIRATEMV